jgi:murein DD-endopeptidase MepM/ murein hydrolase activator NlpD
LEKLFKPDIGLDSGLPDNSQILPLLQAPLNSEPVLGLGGGGITIVNQNALLPDIGPLGSIADIQEKTSQGHISIYIVREGDTLTQIAEMFGVSVNTVRWANNIGGDVIKTGQALIILPISGISHEVKTGDTIEGIAKKWKGDVDEIIRFNDLDQTKPLVAGQVIIIPDGEAPLPPSLSPTPKNPYRGGSGPVYAGYYLRPVIGGRNSRATPSNPRGLHGYNAVDLAVPCGSPILASASGDVLISRNSGWNGGYGKFILIQHSNGTQTLYSHNSSNIVGVGWHVVRGQVIGYVGSTGNATGCHVHFEIRGAYNPF